ncbi:MAG: ABC transporter ATP-binding protein [Gemmatimonadetes bacterium]|nr:ABC transporter ATP-binding protein [Gemmatimonadota bacterium]
MNTETVLGTSGLWANYGATPILQGVDMRIGKGEIVSLIGRNGVGKTTAMRCLIGLLKATGGSISFLGRDITRLGSTQRARLGMGYIPQGREVFPRMTVEENLLVGTLIGGRRGKKLPELVYHHFPRLKERRTQIAGTMSGGEQQMLAIGRALMAHPKLLMLDEPSLGLAPKLVGEIFEIVHRLNAELGTTILLVEQNARLALDLAHRGYVMEGGRIMLEGPAEELGRNPDVQEFYLGLTESGERRNFRELKHYKRRKRWL